MGLTAGAVVAASVVVAMTQVGAAPADEAGGHGFLTRDGKTLMLDGKPYAFVGVNAFGLTGCDGSFTPNSDDDLDTYFQSLRPNSITRTWAFEPQGIEAVDRVVAAAERNNQMLILALGDGANFCNDPGHDAAWFAGGYKTKYLPWLKKVVARYPDSKAIAAWELLNEPKGASSDTVMKAFFDDAAGTIKGIDKNHLVSSGSQAEYVAGTNDFAFVHSGPNIDMASLHEYDWDASGHQIVSNHFPTVIKAMDSINKPLYIGESGIGAADSGCTTRQERATAFTQKFDGYLGGGAVGVLAWNWRGTKQDTCDPFSPGTIYAGDPLMETLRTYDIPDIDEPTGGGGEEPTEEPTATPTEPGEDLPTLSPTATATEEPEPTDEPTGTSDPSETSEPTEEPEPTTTSAPTTPPAEQPGENATVDDTDFTYRGAWRVGDGAGKYQGADQYSQTAGDSYSYTFTGTQVKVYGSVASHHGIASISIDGGAAKTVDFYKATRSDGVLLFTSAKLAAGEHTVTVKVTGQKNAAATNTVVTADRIDVIG